jgi:glycosyltransferase involved in cell wall biosynthesis
MLDAMPRLLQEHPRLRYLIVGDGDHRGSLEEHAKRRGVTTAVEFLGHRSDVAEVLAAGDVFVLPSHTEALPTVIIEAMAAGLPVVATDVGGTGELVATGSSGVLVPPRSPDRLAEAIDRLLRSPRQTAAMSVAGRRLAADRFSIERQAGRLAAEYRVLAASGGSR